MKKKPTPRSLSLGLRVVIPLCVVLVIFAIWRLYDPFISHRPSIPSAVDETFTGPAKVAFLFLVRRHLPLDFVWEHFFKNAGEGKFSVYLHSRPGFVFDAITTQCTYCQGRQLNNSVQVAWGGASMIEAERLLLTEALKDKANQRFVLLSDRCVPLYNFSYVYDYVMSSPKSFVDSFLDLKDERYDPKMHPTIPKDRWRKGSQWITVIRKHAHFVVSDGVIFATFKKHCKRRQALNVDKKGLSNKQIVQKKHDCIPDEHYVQTLLSMKDLENELEKRTLTYTLWNASASPTGKEGWHPTTFKYTDVDLLRVQQIKSIDHVYYETEFRTEWCQSNATLVPCFLFARKFSKGAAMRLLTEQVIGDFDPGSLLGA